MCLNLLIGTGILLAMTVVWFVVYYWLTPHLDSPDAQARITGACGETMEIRMCFEKDKLVKASHWTDGCVYSLNCIHCATQLAKRKTPEEILDITPDDIQASIGELPTDHRHCADLAAETLHSAIDDYMKKKLWKKTT